MKIRISKTCHCCLETKDLHVEEMDDANFINGMNAHKAFPYLSKGIELFMSGKFGQAATYFEHVARSSRELQTMKNNKEMMEQARNVLSLMGEEERKRRVWF